MEIDEGSLSPLRNWCYSISHGGNSKLLQSWDPSQLRLVTALTPPSIPISTLLRADDSDLRDDGLDPIAEAKTEVSEALDDLEVTGALQRSH